MAPRREYYWKAALKEAEMHSLLSSRCVGQLIKRKRRRMIGKEEGKEKEKYKWVSTIWFEIQMISLLFMEFWSRMTAIGQCRWIDKEMGIVIRKEKKK